jgi:hypothetical protein
MPSVMPKSVPATNEIHGTEFEAAEDLSRSSNRSASQQAEAGHAHQLTAKTERNFLISFRAARTFVNDARGLLRASRFWLRADLALAVASLSAFEGR